MRRSIEIRRSLTIACGFQATNMLKLRGPVILSFALILSGTNAQIAYAPASLNTQATSQHSIILRKIKFCDLLNHTAVCLCSGVMQ